MKRLSVGALCVAFLWSATGAVRSVRQLLREAPQAPRLAGLRLSQLPDPGGVMARKPHVAYFAARPFVPLPPAHSLAELLQGSRESHAKFLFFSGLEARLRPHLRPLADTLWTLPGLQGIEARFVSPEDYYHLYRFTGELVSAEAADSAFLEAYRRLVARNPRDDGSRSLFSELLVNAGRPAEALETLSEASGADPSGQFRLHASRAYALYTEREFAAAEEACRRALELAPDHAWANGFLGQILLRVGRVTEAIAPLERAIQGDPAQPSYRFLLGVTWIRRERYPEAAAELQRVVSLDPDFPDAVATAARARAWAGDRAAALALLRAHAKSPPADDLRALADSLARATGTQ